MVTDANNANPSDYIIELVSEIPGKTDFGHEIIGLAKGNVAAAETKGSINYINHIILHELGHILGAGHSLNSFMEPSLDYDIKNRSLNSNAITLKQMWGWLSDYVTTKVKHGHSQQVGDNRENLKNFISNNNIQIK